MMLLLIGWLAYKRSASHCRFFWSCSGPWWGLFWTCIKGSSSSAPRKAIWENRGKLIVLLPRDDKNS
jgi:hypothetical protein